MGYACPTCNQTIDFSDSFCRNCGTPLRSGGSPCNYRPSFQGTIVTCAACEGRGFYPGFFRNTICDVCNGSGKQRV
ncbi:MAG: hypothetical protein IPH75_08125 [bacterium]|nr:hypothetical protein [bacterium]